MVIAVPIGPRPAPLTPNREAIAWRSLRLDAVWPISQNRQGKRRGIVERRAKPVVGRIADEMTIIQQRALERNVNFARKLGDRQRCGRLVQSQQVSDEGIVVRRWIQCDKVIDGFCCTPLIGRLREIGEVDVVAAQDQHDVSWVISERRIEELEIR